MPWEARWVRRGVFFRCCSGFVSLFVCNCGSSIVRRRSAAGCKTPWVTRSLFAQHTWARLQLVVSPRLTWGCFRFFVVCLVGCFFFCDSLMNEKTTKKKKDCFSSLIPTRSGGQIPSNGFGRGGKQRFHNRGAAALFLVSPVCRSGSTLEMRTMWEEVNVSETFWPRQ